MLRFTTVVQFTRDGKLSLFPRFMHTTTELMTSSTPVATSHKRIVLPKPSNTYVNLLQNCANLKELKQLHAHMLMREIVHNIYVGTTLVSMYTKCASAADARMVFDEMPTRNVFSWNAMIAGYAISGFHDEALAVYLQMKQAGIQPDNFTFPCVFKACGALGYLQQGREFHGYVIRSGFESDVFVGSSLVDMYAKCRNLEDAHQVFDKMSQRDLVSWNVMIASYAQNGIGDEALQLFRDMGVAGVMPDSATVVSVLPACAGLEALQQGKEIHHYAIKFRFELDVDVGNALLTMYSKCGRVDDAELVFDKMSERDVVSWNAMIAGYAQNGHFEEAMKFFHQMQQASVKPNRATIVTILPVCGQLVDLQQGKMIQDYIVGSEFESDVSVGNALIDMYAKCCSIENARNLFDRMIQKDVVSWNAMISGYVQNEQFVEALRLFHQMGLAGMKSDWVTIVSVLCSCARLATLHQGKEVHNYIKRNGFESDVSVVNALIDMYAKCGSLENARHIFDQMSRRDLVSWTVMILGYGMHGYGEKALALFYQMQQEGMKPDHITFIAVLIACRHSGMVDEGWKCFNQMQHFSITPSVEHYACVVDLLGRSGHLDEAHKFITNMPLQPNAEVWGALLGACRIHSNIELGEKVAKRLLELAPEHTGYYVLLSNIYSAASRWDEVAKVRSLIKYRGLKKNPGCSWIEVNNVVHSFVVGDRSHPQSEKIFAMLDSLANHMKLAGYVPNTDLVLPDLELEE